jgi:hypothetical protein
MCSGSRCPGSTSGDSVPESTMSRGEISFNEVPNEGLWEIRREPERLELESTRARLANRALGLLGIFILAGIGSITWVSLAGKSAAELGICIEVIATPLFGVVMLVVGYFFGQSTKKEARRQHKAYPNTGLSVGTN